MQAAKERVTVPLSNIFLPEGNYTLSSKYSYDFYLEFTVNNPYFDDFKVKLNTFSVEGVGTMEYNKYQQMAMEIINTLTPGRGVMPNMGMNNGMPMNQGYAPANGYNQQPMNNGYAQQPMNNGYNQQPMNNGYNQPAQPQPQAQGLECPFCGSPYTGGDFCTACGAKMPG